MGTVALALATGQRSTGIEASVWCVDPPSVAAGTGSHEVLVPLPLIGPARLAWSPGGERLARMTAADVVHQHGLWTAQSRITGVFRRRGSATVVAPHGSLEPYARQRSALKKRMALAVFESANLRQASCLHATTEMELHTFRDFGLRRPVAIVPNGVAPEWLNARGDGARFMEQHGLGDQTRVMLFLSRVDPIKGLPLLIEAIGANRDRLRDWCLVIAGPDSHGHRLDIRQLVDRLGLAHVVRVIGPLYDAEKADAFAAAELFVLPTHSENFGLVVAEALASGVPVVTTHGAPWPALEADGCGWWVPCDSHSIGIALVDACRRTADALAAMGARGQALIAAKYTWPAITQQTLELYRWLRGERERPAFVVVG
jgi:glycosyltransferase involved in cell wall biosynthesis